MKKLLALALAATMLVTLAVPAMAVVSSPTVEVSQPTNAIIVDASGETRAVQVALTNEESAITAPEAVETISTQGAAAVVEAVQSIDKLIAQDATAQAEVTAFGTQNQAKVDEIYSAFGAYLSETGIADQYPVSSDAIAKLLYFATKYLPVGGELSTALESGNSDAYLNLGLEVVKSLLGIIAGSDGTLLDSSTVMTFWALNDPNNTDSTISNTMAYFVYDDETGKWVMVDALQMTIQSDALKPSETLNITLNTSYISTDNANAKIMAMYYDESAGQWVVAGMNGAAISMMIGE